MKLIDAKPAGFLIGTEPSSQVDPVLVVCAQWAWHSLMVTLSSLSPHFVGDTDADAHRAAEHGPGMLTGPTISTKDYTS